MRCVDVSQRRSVTIYVVFGLVSLLLGIVAYPVMMFWIDPRQYEITAIYPGVSLHGRYIDRRSLIYQGFAWVPADEHQGKVLIVLNAEEKEPMELTQSVFINMGCEPDVFTSGGIEYTDYSMVEYGVRIGAVFSGDMCVRFYFRVLDPNAAPSNVVKLRVGREVIHFPVARHALELALGAPLELRKQSLFP